MLRRFALIAALGLAGCSSAEETPEEPTPIQDRSAPAPAPTPQTALADGPPLGTPRAKIAPDSVVPGTGDRTTIR